MLNRLAAALLASLLAASANADTPRRNLLHSAPLATLPLSENDDIEVVQDGYSTRIPATTVFPVEGSWTPNLIGTTTTGSVTYDDNTGTYEAFGYDVFIRFTIDTSAISGFAGAIEINPLPIPVFDGDSSSARAACAMGVVGGVTNTAGYTNVLALVDPTAQSIQFLQSGSGSPIGFLSAPNLSNNTVLSGSCVYRRK